LFEEFELGLDPPAALLCPPGVNDPAVGLPIEGLRCLVGSA